MLLNNTINEYPSGDIMYFNSDDEFFNFCVDPTLFIKYEENPETGSKDYYYDFNFTKAYDDAINNGKRFCIKDDNSIIAKNGEIAYKLITKPVQNLEQYINMDKICLKK